MTAENEAFEAEGEPPAEEDDGGATDAESLAGFEGLQQTIEALATEIDELADGSQGDDDLAAIEEQVEGAVEALVTLREARSQINALKRDRGFRGPGSTGFKGGKGRGKKGSTAQAKRMASALLVVRLVTGKVMLNALQLARALAKETTAKVPKTNAEAWNFIVDYLTKVLELQE